MLPGSDKLSQIDLDAVEFRRPMRRQRPGQQIALENEALRSQTGHSGNHRRIGAVGGARLHRLPVNCVERQRQHRRDHRLADAGIGAGDDERGHFAVAASARCSAAPSASISASVRSTPMEMRRREVPTGTVGGRMARTSNPSRRSESAAVMA